MSDQTNPTQDTPARDAVAEGAVQNEETLQEELDTQDATVDEPQEGEFEPSNGAPIEDVTADAEVDSEEVVAAEPSTEEAGGAEEAMSTSFAEQEETVEGSNTFEPGAESASEPSTNGAVEGDERGVKVQRTNGPAMFELPERMARNRRVRDAKIEDIHYKNIPMLVRFLDTYGRILSRRRTGVSAKMQRRVVQSVKLARELSLLPYTNEHNRLSRKNR